MSINSGHSAPGCISSHLGIHYTDRWVTSRQTYFNTVASTWDQRYYSPELAQWLTQVVPTWGLQRDDHVLDVGTGTGLLIPFIQQVIGPSGSIAAIDYADHMVQICRSKYGHLSNVTIKLQNIEDLDFPSASFNAITCFGVFPHIDYKVLALEHFYRVLKSGGKLIIAHALSRAEINAHHQNTEPAVANDLLPDASEMQRLLHSVGFIDISVTDACRYYLCLSMKSYPRANTIV